MEFDWKHVGMSISIRDDGPKYYKTYRRRGRTFWRNYRRDVPGGVSFVGRLAASLAEQERRMRERLAEVIR